VLGVPSDHCGSRVSRLIKRQKLTFLIGPVSGSQFVNPIFPMFSYPNIETLVSSLALQSSVFEGIYCICKVVFLHSGLLYRGMYKTAALKQSTRLHSGSPNPPKEYIYSTFDTKCSLQQLLLRQKIVPIRQNFLYSIQNTKQPNTSEHRQKLNPSGLLDRSLLGRRPPSPCLG